MKRTYFQILLLFLIVQGISYPSQAKNLNILFLNPGGVKDIGVWHMVSTFMQAAADDLGIQLDVLYSDRDHIKMMAQAEQISRQETQPDYVIMVNEKEVGKQMLLNFENSRSKIFFVHNSLTVQQREKAGNERENFKNWIGTVTTDDRLAGYKLIKELIRYTQKEPKIIGITGTKATPVSLIRLQGVRDYLKKSRKGEHYQVVYGKWSYEDGKNKALTLLKRYPDANILWAANDSMAFGAFDAARTLGIHKNISIGGLGGFPFALDSIKKGEMKVTVAGHPMIGAWALVLIYDYHNGFDFKDGVGTNLKIDHLTVIDTPKKADQYLDLVLKNPQQINFRKFSRKLNTNLKKYDFRYSQVVKAAN
ncbi:MAG: ABC transporter substrate-binding protein [Deltaproteobacteria bacterium]|jgi:ABC-type sugar transport system substrate-binding protein|nr:ABC transporter substrate-binding protein [Deltaproteobacteria bacterium]MBT4263721.1 ABC transporter substrate-binding protein [Deltaproteobacteria bacterium]MBT4643304.1 ABC transporter substrate-binding protein [Deltaproteobacteria bacterium]MBT7152231.1 ABC transporter substrate-binding protein [Deltaproteobacteria bacterium]